MKESCWARSAAKNAANGEERGKKQGSMNEKLIIARRMLEKNYPMEQVVDLTMLTKQEVEELSRTIKS